MQFIYTAGQSVSSTLLWQPSDILLPYILFTFAVLIFAKIDKCGDGAVAAT